MRYREPTIKEQILCDNLTRLAEMIKESRMTGEEKQNALFTLGTIHGLTVQEKE